MQDSSGWDFSSPKPQRFQSFAKYQVNRSELDQSDSDEEDGYKPSMNFLKVGKKHLGGGNAMEGLPGLERSVKSSEESPEKPQEEFTPAKSCPERFEWIGTRPFPAQVKYLALMIIFLMGRTSLNPFLVNQGASPVAKLIWRNLIVGISNSEKSASFIFILLKTKSTAPEISLVSLRDRGEQRNMGISVLCFVIWTFSSVYSAHYTGLLEGFILANQPILMNTLFKLFNR